MYHSWTNEEIEYLREIYPYYTNKEIVFMLEKKFNFTVKAHTIKTMKTTYNFPNKINPNPKRFKKGHTPWNKGVPHSKETKKKLERVTFEKGNKTWNTKPIGTTRVNRAGYKEIKVANPNKWEKYHRYIYEKAHKEKLSSTDRVIFADGDKTNFNIDNLVKVQLSDLVYLNRSDLISNNKEITKANIYINRINVKVRELEEK